MSAAILAILYLVSPYVIEYPKATIAILALAMLTSVGAGIRSMLEMGILWPMAKVANGIGRFFVACPFIFLVAMLIAVTLPWLNGVSGFNAWRWFSSIGFTLFNFETFYSFISATLRIYNCESETEMKECKNQKRTREIKDDNVSIGLFDRLLLAIPFIRHLMAKRNIRKRQDENKLIDTINRSYGYMNAPNIVKLYNDGKVDQQAMCSPEYHKYVVSQWFGKKAKDIAEQIKIERARVRNNTGYDIYLVHVPSTKDIGQSDVVAFVVNPANKANFYTWEWSVNNNRVICSFENKSHLNFGICNDKAEFVKRIVELSND